MNKPKVFIASSSQSVELANIIREQISNVADGVIWADENIFPPGAYTLEVLLEIKENFDFFICLFYDDDKIEINDRKFSIPRDNVLIEYGLFLSSLDRKRVFIVEPSRSRDKEWPLRTPTDLSGLNVIRFNNVQSGENFNDKDIIERIKAEVSNKISYNIINLGGTSGFLKRYAKSDEPPLKDGKILTKDRIYNILLYMFSGDEIFKDFCALDLAYHRWAEALKKDESQTRNFYLEIMAAMRHLFTRFTGQNRSLNFKRILVVPKEEIEEDVTIRILNLIYDFEKEWYHFSGLFVKTKILIYDESNEVIYSRIFKQFGDFAVFTGHAEEFAIVERRTDPRAKDIQEDCFVEFEKKQNIVEKRREFDNLWKEATEIPVILDLKRQHPPTKNSPIHEAFQRLEDSIKSNYLNTALIIETNYIDLDNLNSDKRKQHQYDAFHLLDKIQSSFPLLRQNIFVSAFINDFTVDCGVNYCPNPADTDNPKKAIVEKIIENFKSINKSYVANHDNMIVSKMRKTKDLALKKINDEINNKNPKIIIEGKDVSIINEQSNIQVGYARDGRCSTARCSLLMAEHYHSLFYECHRARMDIKQVFIIDFNTNHEKAGVVNGAKATFIYNSFPEDVLITIINCNYLPNSDDGKIITTHSKKII